MLCPSTLSVEYAEKMSGKSNDDCNSELTSFFAGGEAMTLSK